MVYRFLVNDWLTHYSYSEAHRAVAEPSEHHEGLPAPSNCQVAAGATKPGRDCPIGPLSIVYNGLLRPAKGTSSFRTDGKATASSQNPKTGREGVRLEARARRGASYSIIGPAAPGFTKSLTNGYACCAYLPQ